MMKEQFENTDSFNWLVDSLKTDLSVGKNHSISDVKETRDLESKILAATYRLNQYASVDGEDSMSTVMWRQWRLKFALPLAASMALGTAIFMLIPSVISPNKLRPVASNAIAHSHRAFEEAHLGAIAFAQMNVAQTEADITFQELWFTEDEWLFLE